MTDVSFTIPSPSEYAWGLAVTQDGRIFLSTQDQSLPKAKFNFYALDPKSGSLLALPHHTSLSWEDLVGADGDSLVALGGDRAGLKTAFYEVQP